MWIDALFFRLHLQTDPTFGSLREPIIKVLHLLRSLSYKPSKGMGTALASMDVKVGQMAYRSPGVFNFYLPEFVPAGVMCYKRAAA